MSDGSFETHAKKYGHVFIARVEWSICEPSRQDKKKKTRVGRVFALDSFLFYLDRSSYRVNWVLGQPVGPVRV